MPVRVLIPVRRSAMLVLRSQAQFSRRVSQLDGAYRRPTPALPGRQHTLLDPQEDLTYLQSQRQRKTERKTGSSRRISPIPHAPVRDAACTAR
jgi:hypothetical protein